MLRREIPCIHKHVFQGLNLPRILLCSICTRTFIHQPSPLLSYLASLTKSLLVAQNSFTHHLLAMGAVGRFVIRKEVKTLNNHNPFDEGNSSPNYGLIDRQRQANDLRVKIPVTRLGVKPESNVSSPPVLAKALAARHFSPQTHDQSLRQIL